MLKRCAWPKSDLAISYHDKEWGVPLHDERALFEFLVLEGAQAGLSWETVLQKRNNYREAFDNFEPATVAKFTARKIERLLVNPGIIRCLRSSERKRFPGNSEGVWQLRRLPVGFCGSSAVKTKTRITGSGPNRTIGQAQQGPGKTRL